MPRKSAAKKTEARKYEAGEGHGSASVEGALRAAGERYEAAVSARGNFAELARTLPKQFSHGDAQLEQALRALQGGHQIIWSESLR